MRELYVVPCWRAPGLRERCGRFAPAVRWKSRHREHRSKTRRSRFQTTQPSSLLNNRALSTKALLRIGGNSVFAILILFGAFAAGLSSCVDEPIVDDQQLRLTQDSDRSAPLSSRADTGCDPEEGYAALENADNMASWASIMTYYLNDCQHIGFAPGDVLVECSSPQARQCAREGEYIDARSAYTQLAYYTNCSCNQYYVDVLPVDEQSGECSSPDSPFTHVYVLNCIHSSVGF